MCFLWKEKRRKRKKERVQHKACQNGAQILDEIWKTGVLKWIKEATTPRL
jgi:hypothetical protein